MKSDNNELFWIAKNGPVHTSTRLGICFGNWTTLVALALNRLFFGPLTITGNSLLHFSSLMVLHAFDSPKKKRKKEKRADSSESSVRTADRSRLTRLPRCSVRINGTMNVREPNQRNRIMKIIRFLYFVKEI